jgi:HPr Serine kinase C-terminal domain
LPPGKAQRGVQNVTCEASAGVRNDVAARGTRATTPSERGDRVICGWRVRSAVPLPDAMPWTGDDRPPDVTIRFGSAPALIDPVLHGTGPMQVGRDGLCRLGIDNIASFLTREGREVVVEPRGDISNPEFRSWLLGPVLGMLCHQRGLFPLHAACVRIGDGAVALAGRTGAGKSTLAAALVRRGHGLIADDVCVIEPAAPGGPRVLPSFPRLKLWEDVLQALEIPVDGMPRAKSGKRKFHFCQPGSFDPSPVRLHAVYLLVRSEQEEISRVIGAEAARLLSNEIYRRPIGFHLGRKVALLTDALRIAAAVPLFRLPVRLNLSELDAVAEGVEAHHRMIGRNCAMRQNSLPGKPLST